MTTTDQKQPIAVLLFHAAMQRKCSLADFANELNLSVATLRSYLFEGGKRARIRGKTLEKMAEVLHLPVDEVREDIDLLPKTNQLFGEWLTEQIKGRFTRAGLCATTRISDSAMKNYLSGQTTPDPDNAMRLAEALGADALEVARLIVATEMHKRGAELVLSAESAESAEPAKKEGESAPAPAPVRPAEPAATPAPEPITDEAVVNAYNEQRLLNLWRRLHPQGRRATLTYIASLLAEGM